MRACWRKRIGTSFWPLAVLIPCLTAGAGATDPAWTVDTVYQAGTGKFTSLKADKGGSVHVASVAEDGHLLKYSFWDHSLKRWFTMTVDQDASFCSIALDSKQHPHISYADFGTTNGAKLKHAYWDGTSWVKETIPLNAEIIAYYTSIVLDKNDNPSISFYEYTGPKGTDFRVRMRVVTKTAGYWQVRTVDGDNQSGKFNALAMDAQGHIHLAYANVSALTAGVRYGYWDGKSWKLDLVDGREQNNTDLVGYSVCITLDKDVNPHLAYMNYSHPALKYAVRERGQWRTQVVDQLTNVAYPDRNSIGIDDQGQVYISYYDAGRGILKLAHQEGQKWMIEVVDSNASGETSSLQIDHGTMWISYADEADGGLKVAHRELRAGVISGAAKVRQPEK
jgi:hypothetical protein